MLPDEPYQLPPEFRQQPLAARALEDYALCPRRFLLSFFVGREEERRFHGGPAALHTAVRHALVECYGRGGPHLIPVEPLLDSFEAHWQGDLCADSIEEQQLHDQGRRMLQDYYDDHRGDTVEVVATDQRFEGAIEGQAFVAVADVVLQPHAGGPEVVRFVTARRPPDEDQLRADLSAQVLWLLAHERYDTNSGSGDRVGASIPSRVGARVPTRATTDAPLRILFHSLRQRLSHEVLLSPEEADLARRDLAARAARLYREHDFAPVKGSQCRYCRVRHRCPQWQR